MATVILTDEQGTPAGLADLVAAHSGEGLLHKAFSVYVFRNRFSELLIQQRSLHKLLWPLYWANTCCSHPRAGDNIRTAGERRLQEECGFTCRLREHSSFVYRAVDPERRGVEHENVTILLGEVDHDTACLPNPQEIAAFQWISLAALRTDMEQHPQKYAPWFRLGMERIGWDPASLAVHVLP
jgi:isopentenyl-diphosphate delta-isomerase